MENLILGDSFEYLKTIPDKSVDLILTDPPYEFVTGGKGRGKLSQRMEILKSDISFITKGYDMPTIFNEFIRICKIPNIIIFCSNRQLSTTMKFFEDLGLMATCLVWCKTNPSPCNNGNYLSDIEYIVYVRGKGATFNNFDVPFDFTHKYYLSPIVQPKVRYHPTQKPTDLIKRFVLLHSKENDTVLDCFMGSGTTGVVCKELNRNFIGIEIEENFYNIAKKKNR